MSTAQTYRGLRIDNILVCTEESKKKKVFYNGGKFLKNISNHLYNRDSGQGHGKKKEASTGIYTELQPPAYVWEETFKGKSRSRKLLFKNSDETLKRTSQLTENLDGYNSAITISGGCDIIFLEMF